MEEIKFVDFIKVYFKKPINALTILLNQSTHKYAFLLPVIFGFILGINDIINKSYLQTYDLNIGSVGILISKEILIVLFACYVYSWIVVFLNSFFEGYSSQSMVFYLISYSLMPLILGSILVTILKLIAFLAFGRTEYGLIIVRYLSAIYFAFYVLTLIFLIVGNSILNGFSIFKSIMPSAIIPVISIIYTMSKFLNHSLKLNKHPAI
ncbi:MAG: hypothetical protein IPN67_19855 [Bacteroidales bacterium]|nr:hypothetical protein [Bacteroidales bacterium]